MRQRQQAEAVEAGGRGRTRYEAQPASTRNQCLPDNKSLGHMHQTGIEQEQLQRRTTRNETHEKPYTQKKEDLFVGVT